MNADALTLGEAKQIASMFHQPAAVPAPARSEGKQIVVLDRGFVYVGDVTLTPETVVIENALNVRRWGTTRGLGELAANGPTENTLLDPTPTVIAPKHALIHLIACTCEASKWTR